MAEQYHRQALELERADPKTSVTFVHLACSGGTITEGLLGKYAGIEAPRPGMSKRPAQIHHAAGLTAGREVDAFVTSIGGNDVGFAPLIQACITSEPCFLPTSQISDAEIVSLCNSFDEAQGPIGAVRVRVCQASLMAARERLEGSNVDEQFRTNLASLPGKYADVQTRIEALWPELPADRMFLTRRMRGREQPSEHTWRGSKDLSGEMRRGGFAWTPDPAAAMAEPDSFTGGVVLEVRVKD